MNRWLAECDAALGRGVTRVCLLAVIAGATAFAAGAATAHGPRVFGALIAGWLFLAGTVMGAIAFAAVLELGGARWARPLIALASAVTSFVPVACVVLVLIVVGLPAWAPWYDAGPSHETFWLNVPFFATRELLAGVALFGLAYLGMRPGDSPSAAPRGARTLVVFLVVFAVVLSIWSFDFVVALDPTWASTGIGFHVFVGAAASGAGLLILLSLGWGRLDKRLRHDCGTLLLTLTLLWGYLFWSHFLTIWYANLPAETAFVLRRMTPPWKLEAAAVILLCFVVPFALMMRPRNKSNPRWLGIAAAAQIGGLWLERHLLVLPSLSPASGSSFDPLGGLVSLGLAAAFLLAVGRPFMRLRTAAT